MIHYTTKEAQQLSQTYYGIKCIATSLAGEADQNFYLKSNNGQAYTLKISPPNTSLKILAFQADILKHLATKDMPFQIPQVIPSINGQEVMALENGQYLRVQTWLDGRMLAAVNPRSPKVLENWGKTAGQLSQHLQDFEHPAAQRFYKWNPSETLHAKPYQDYIKGEEEQAIAHYFWNLFEKEALPQLPHLRKSVNYNDAHEHNLLVDCNVKHPQITGVIDFGDALYTQTINELAIACAYASMHLPDPLEATANVVKGYHEVFPIEEQELVVLFPLIGARLMIRVANAAYNQEHEADNEYLSISKTAAWEVLKKWRNIPPSLAHYTFRRACGLVPNPKQPIFEKWIAAHQGKLAPIVDFHDKKVVHLDLSVGSLDLGNNSNFETIGRFCKTIDTILEDKNADMGFGGYAETRPFYTTDAYQVESNSGAQWRTVHLGMDVWAVAETPVFAPLDGRVHSFQNNAADCDYGPTIILEHQVAEDLRFYTLYGHLSLASLKSLQKGQRIKKGQQIATIGPPPVNGNWPPHLHFQVILDMLGKVGDFPGVAFPHELETWLSNSPNPAPFFPNISSKNTQKTATEILNTRKKSLGKSLSISYQQPLHMVRGFKQYLYDTTGRRYLDTVNNVPHVGHQHPRVVKAAQRQIGVLNTNTRYLHENITQFAEELLATFPPELSVVHFVNSGSEANELALRMVEAYTGQKNMIAVEVGYHGNTSACIDVSSYKFGGKGGKGAPANTHIVPIPDTYRGLYQGEDAGERYAAHVQQAIENIAKSGQKVGGFICESIISCGGQVVLPKGYLQKSYQAVRAAGGLCIADEVQVGFGRVGEAFWAFELQGVVPDMVTMGKPIGNGHPLAAVVTTQEVATAFANGMEYFNTFGGNPVSCAIGREVLQIIKDENLQAQAQQRGEYLIAGLKGLKSQFPIIGDVRGHGLFLGFELIKNIETLEPAAAEASYLANRMRERGILMSTDGPFHNVLKIKPPMCFHRANADFLLSNLERVLSEDFLKLKNSKVPK